MHSGLPTAHLLCHLSQGRQLEDCAWLHSFPSLSLCPRYPRLVFPPTLPIILDVITHYNVTHKGKRPLCLQTDLLWLTLAWGLKKKSAKFDCWPTDLATFAFDHFFPFIERKLADYFWYLWQFPCQLFDAASRRKKYFLLQLYAGTVISQLGELTKFTINANWNIYFFKYCIDI